MATKAEVRIAVVEEKVDRANQDIKEIKTDVKSGFEMVGNKLDELPNTFFTRREATQLKWVFGAIIAVCTLIATVAAIFIK